VRRIGSICTGAFLLAQAGLLDGRRCTTHWQWTQALAARFPAVEVDPKPIWIQQGRIFTSAGFTAGMDLALALVEHDLGGAVALESARCLVLFLHRPGGQAQFSISLAAQHSERTAIAELEAWMAEHHRGRVTVEALATRAAMSQRNFGRVFVRELGATPAKYLEALRVETACRLLEETDHGPQAGRELRRFRQLT